jgi:uncharacterized protein (TIGR00251 family)
MTPDQALTALAKTKQGVTLRVKVTAQARWTRVVGLVGNRVKVFVTAPPESGKANEAACNCLANALGVPKSNVSVTWGKTDPRKTVLIQGITLEEAADRLAICTPADSDE